MLKIKFNGMCQKGQQKSLEFLKENFFFGLLWKRKDAAKKILIKAYQIWIGKF